MKKLLCGNTNTYFVGGLLIDTGYAGSISQFFKSMKGNGIGVRDIKYVAATHYHPDHMGLIGDLTELGARLLLLDVQKAHVHFSDSIFARDGIPCKPIEVSSAIVISCAESRGFLAENGIGGEIIHTPSHSADSVSFIMDSGDCFVGDLEPFEYIEAYEDNAALKNDWKRILSYDPKRVYYAHRPCREF